MDKKCFLFFFVPFLFIKLDSLSFFHPCSRRKERKRGLHMKWSSSRSRVCGDPRICGHSWECIENPTRQLDAQGHWSQTALWTGPPAKFLYTLFSPNFLYKHCRTDGFLIWGCQMVIFFIENGRRCLKKLSFKEHWLALNV